MVGAPSAFTDFGSDSFKAILAEVVAKHPEVAGWTPYDATKQVISGYKYDFKLKSPSGEAVAVTVIQNAMGVITVPQYKALPNYYKGFALFEDNRNISFRRALAEAERQHASELQACELNTTELFISSRFYYFKFTFTSINNGNATANIVLTQALGFENPAITATKETDSGEVPCREREYKDAYWKLMQDQMNYAFYEIIFVTKKTVDGSTIFKFTMDKTFGPYERVNIAVTLTPKKTYEIAVLDKDTSKGYSLDLVNQVKLWAVQTWPELSSLTLSTITNLNSDGSGLKLTYKKDSTTKVINFDVKDNTETLTMEA